MNLAEHISPETWRPKKDVAVWYLEVAPFEAGHYQNNYLHTLKGSFESLEDVFYPLRISIDLRSDPPVDAISIVHDHRSVEVILEEVKQVLSTLDSQNVYCITIELATQAYTLAEERTPQLQWSALGDYLRIYAGQGDLQPNAALGLSHTLFLPANHRYFLDNRELYQLNQPLLEKALKNWEKALGKIVEFEGPSNTFEHGFLPDDTPAEWTQQRAAHQKGEEFLPDQMD